MTRSEEELRVGTESRERGRARLRKYVVTETQQVTVPVQREEVRVEREPITDANLDAATSGPAISEEEHEVTLREEEVVVDKRAVPKKRVRLDTETVTDERQVSEEVRKEHPGRRRPGPAPPSGPALSRIGSGKAAWIAGRPSLLPTPRTPTPGADTCRTRPPTARRIPACSAATLRTLDPAATPAGPTPPPPPMRTIPRRPPPCPTPTLTGPGSAATSLARIGSGCPIHQRSRRGRSPSRP